MLRDGQKVQIIIISDDDWGWGCNDATGNHRMILPAVVRCQLSVLTTTTTIATHIEPSSAKSALGWMMDTYCTAAAATHTFVRALCTFAVRACDAAFGLHSHFSFGFRRSHGLGFAHFSWISVAHVVVAVIVTITRCYCHKTDKNNSLCAAAACGRHF